MRYPQAADLLSRLQAYPPAAAARSQTILRLRRRAAGTQDDTETDVEVEL